MSVLSEADKTLLPLATRSAGGFHLATKWYFGWEPLWYQYMFHQATTPKGLICPNSSWIAGIACVAGETEILDPTTGLSTPIKDLVGKEITVMAWTGEQFVQAKANPPFLKGRADLYRVQLQSGKSIVTTLEHRFLTPNGYVALKEFRPGHCVGVLSTLDHSTLLVGDRHCDQIPQDCPDGYSVCFHQYDGQPHRGKGNDPAFAQQQDGEDECIQHEFYRGALQELLREYNHQHQFSDHHASSDYVRRAELPVFASRPRNMPKIRELPLDLVPQSPVQFARKKSQRGPSQLFDLSMDPAGWDVSYSSTYRDVSISQIQDAFGCKGGLSSQFQETQKPLPSFHTDHIGLQDTHELYVTSSYEACGNSYNNYRTFVLWDQVENIVFERTDDFYDMHVPLYENYVGNGIVNHNTGKTTGVAASYLIDCLTIPYFRALNTSVTAKQAELPFEMVLPWIEGNKKIEHLISDVVLRPYPTISFTNGSEWVFRTAGKDAKFIRGMEFDRINYDEAGLDPTGVAVQTLRGRLRGKRPDGAPRMIRLDVTTSPTASPWLEERFNRGVAGNLLFDPESYLSMRISTYMNTHLTKQTIQLMEAELSDDMIAVELGGYFPTFGMSMFPKKHILACTDQSLNDAVELALRPESGKPKKGYLCEEHGRNGIVEFMIPPSPGELYILAGDPGTDGPPRRNAGVIGVIEVSKKPNRLVYFHWVDGQGSYNPFLNSFKRCIEIYRPIMKGIDATGTQKAIDELAFENVGIAVDGINFSRDKQGILNSLSLAITNHDLAWPAIKGLTRQISSYSQETDDKLPQDIVMTVGMLAFLARYAPQLDDEPADKERIGRIQRRNERSRLRGRNR